jgi:hypothetical protein
MPMFWNALSHLHRQVTMKMEQTECSEMLAYKIQSLGNYSEECPVHVLNRVTIHLLEVVTVYAAYVFTMHLC